MLHNDQKPQVTGDKKPWKLSGKISDYYLISKAV